MSSEISMRTSTPDSVRWGSFLRALAQEVDAHGGAEGRDVLLRGVGQRLADSIRLPAVNSLEAFGIEINLLLAEWGWGSADIRLDDTERCISIVHRNLPVIGSGGEPAGSWLAAALEGLYEAWLLQLPDCDSGFSARRIANAAQGDVVIRFAKSPEGT